MIFPSRTTTAPIGTSPSSSARRASSRARRMKSSSVMLEARFAPGKRGLQPLLAREVHEAALVGRAMRLDRVIDVERRGERGAHALDLVGAVERLLRVAHQIGIDDRNMSCDGERRREVLALRYDAAHDAQGERALGPEGGMARAQQVFRRLRADHPWQEQRDDAGAKLELGLAEYGVARAHRDIAGERHFERSRHAGAVNRGDGGLRRIPEAHRGGEIELQDLAPLGWAFWPAGHLLLQVEAGREAAAGTRQDDRPHLGIGFQPIEGRMDLLQHRLAEGIDALGTVELQMRYRSFAFDPNRLVGGHTGVLSKAGASSPRSSMAAKRARSAFPVRPAGSSAAK